MADVGTGLSVAFGTTSFTAEIIGVNGNDVSREVIETSHLSTTTWKTFMPGDLTDPGELELEIAFDPDDTPPHTNAAETVTVTFPTPTGKTSGATLACSMFLTSWNWGAPLEGKMTANITLKCSGTPTWTDSST